MADQDLAAVLTKAQAEQLPGVLGLEWAMVTKGEAQGRMTVAQRHMAPNGFLHAASVIALADSACGYACMASLPEGATGFTTIELKSNFLGTARIGEGVACQARLIHGGRNTQVWDAVVTNEASGKTMALFRCTQMVLYPKT
jgi:uncharacterized protein (TIGR00369 family)